MRFLLSIGRASHTKQRAVCVSSVATFTWTQSDSCRCGMLVLLLACLWVCAPCHFDKYVNKWWMGKIYCRQENMILLYGCLSLSFFVFFLCRCSHVYLITRVKEEWARAEGSEQKSKYIGEGWTTKAEKGGTKAFGIDTHIRFNFVYTAPHINICDQRMRLSSHMRWTSAVVFAVLSALIEHFTKAFSKRQYKVWEIYCAARQRWWCSAFFFMINREPVIYTQRNVCKRSRANEFN